nr:unkown protein [Riptortus pedestris]
MVQHLQFWDFISLSGSKEGKYIEYVDQQHEHFKVPVVIQSAAYIPPLEPGYSVEIFPDTMRKHEFPNGEIWKNIRTS